MADSWLKDAAGRLTPRAAACSIQAQQKPPAQRRVLAERRRPEELKSSACKEQPVIELRAGKTALAARTMTVSALDSHPRRPAVVHVSHEVGAAGVQHHISSFQVQVVDFFLNLTA